MKRKKILAILEKYLCDELESEKLFYLNGDDAQASWHWEMAETLIKIIKEFSDV